MANYLIHSKGPWKKHKYIRKIGDKYYYADSEGNVNDETDYQSYRNKSVTDSNKLAREADKVVGMTSYEYRQAMGLTSKKYEADKKKKSEETTSRPKNVSKEYLEELESNSKKNSYPEGMSSNTKAGEKKPSISDKVKSKLSDLATSAKSTLNKGQNFLKDKFSITTREETKVLGTNKTIVKETKTPLSVEVKNLASKTISSGKKFLSSIFSETHTTGPIAKGKKQKDGSILWNYSDGSQKITDKTGTHKVKKK